jgi:hypothetical protein
MRLPGPWAESFGDCEISPSQEQSAQDASRQVESEYENVHSAADDKDYWEQFLRGVRTGSGFVLQSIEYTLMPETRFTMEPSGIEVVIYAPENVAIDREKFTELFHAPLRLEPQSVEHEGTRQLLDCYRQSILQERKFEGELFRVYIAPDKGYCIDEWRFKRESEVKQCLGQGFTPPMVDLDLVGLTLGEYRFMMLSTKSMGQDANRKMSQLIIHEGFHALSNVMEKQPFRLNPDEQLTKYVENLTLSQLYPNGLPIAIRYQQTD